MLFDLSMSRHRLTGAIRRVLIPIMASAMTDEGTAKLLNLLYEVATLHATCSSPTRRGEGIAPDVRSW